MTQRSLTISAGNRGAARLMMFRQGRHAQERWLSVLFLVPVVIFSALGQRYLVRGLTFGAVKE